MYAPWCLLVSTCASQMAALSKFKRQCLRLSIAAFAVMLIRKKRNKRRRPRRWVLPHITKHEEQGCYANLVRELRTSDVASFANFSRLYPELFDRILELVTPDIERRNTFFRNCISPGERLAITLRFLATGKYIHTVPPIFNFDTHQVQ